MATSEDLARLAEFRLQIDAIDEQLLTVLAQRAALVAQAWRLKENTGMPQRNAERAGHPRARRHHHCAAGAPSHGGGERVRLERHPLAEDELAHRARAFDAVQVVLHDRVVDAG